MLEVPAVDRSTSATNQPPAGVRLRPYAGEVDLAEIVRLENAEHVADDTNDLQKGKR